MDIEALQRELVKQQLQTSPSHLNKIGLVKRRCHREVLHELTVDQQQQQSADDTCTKLLENPTTDSRRFWGRRTVTGEEMSWVFYRNAANRENMRIKPAAQPNTV